MKLAIIFILFVASTQAEPDWGGFFKELGQTVGHYAKKVLVAHKKPEIYDTEKPKFCGKYECPSYAVMKKTDNYEKRCYASGMWVATEAKGSSGGMFNPATRKMFKKLFAYIKGENAKGVEIDMTVPVLTTVKPTADGKTSVFRMHFYVPSKFQKDVPKPTDPSVMVMKMKPCAYVRSFGGYVFFYSRYEKEVAKLKADLEKDGLGKSYDPTMFGYTGYNSPWKVLDRHNEVWLMSK